MSRSADPGHFFQTDASESTRARKEAKKDNQNGEPIVLQSKILAVIRDPNSTSGLYVAESAGCVRKVNIETKDSKTVYRGPTAPITSVAIGGPNNETVFGGCWDKDIWSWNISKRSLAKRYKGHSDFVKAVICARIGEEDVLISGGADAKIIVWSVKKGMRIHVLRDKSETMMAVQCLTLDPLFTTPDSLLLFSSSSDPHIRRWTISLTSSRQLVETTASELNQVTRETILEHETSIYCLLFSDEDDEEEQRRNLWTASADGTAKCLSRSREWAAEETFEHGDYVRAIALTPDWIITAGRSEDVKVWSSSTGELYHVYDGHYEEVTGLIVMAEGKKVVSVSIDKTIRTWSLLKSDMEKLRKEREDTEKGVVKEENASAVTKSVLTEEEEKELAELMDDSD